jgi:hypothetical protein
MIVRTDFPDEDIEAEDRTKRNSSFFSIMHKPFSGDSSIDSRGIADARYEVDSTEIYGTLPPASFLSRESIFDGMAPVTI